MAPETKSRKRKAITSEVPLPQDSASDDELQNGDLDGILSQSEDESVASDEIRLSDSEEGYDEDTEESDIEGEEEEDSDEEEDIREQFRNLKTSNGPLLSRKKKSYGS